MDIQFKKDLKEDIFHFIAVSGHKENVSLENKYVETGKATTQKTPLEKGLGFYLDFASFLTAQLQKFVLIRYSPFVKNQGFIKEHHDVQWKYKVLANDFDGLGVDKGFMKIADESNTKGQGTDEQKHVLFAFNDLNVMKDWPEDTFGDHSSAITIFGLKEGRNTALIAFLQAREQPILSQFLRSGEMLINISYGKDFGFFNSFLVKSKNDIENEMLEFENLINSGN